MLCQLSYGRAETREADFRCSLRRFLGVEFGLDFRVRDSHQPPDKIRELAEVAVSFRRRGFGAHLRHTVWKGWYAGVCRESTRSAAIPQTVGMDNAVIELAQRMVITEPENFSREVALEFAGRVSDAEPEARKKVELRYRHLLEALASGKDVARTLKSFVRRG
jgi:hypothetical protein